MPDPASTRIVVNSYVLEELAAAAPGNLGQSRGKDLLQVIRRHRHVVCITDNLRKEYVKAAKSYSSALIIPGLRLLETKKVVIQTRPGSLSNLVGKRQSHGTFFEEAIRVRSRYFLTDRPKWLRLRETLERQGLLVVTPEDYITRQRS